MSYQDYLNSDHWKITRLRILERDDFKCRVCGTRDAELHVHHNTYKNLGHEPDSDLVTLCNQCHGIFHNRLKPSAGVVFGLVQDLISAFRRNGRLLSGKDLKQPIDYSISYDDLERRKKQIPPELSRLERAPQTETRDTRIRALIKEKMWINDQTAQRDQAYNREEQQWHVSE
jgi:hypothetical protein